MASQPATATIRIAENPIARIRSEQSSHSTGVAPAISYAGGIYHTRSISRASVSRRSLSRGPHDRSSATAASGNDVEEGDNWRDDQVKKKQVFRGTTLLWYVLAGMLL
jgi:hypothetical protein